LRDAAFEVVSITTTTGFSTANFDLWPSFSILLLVALMFFGGSAGSTGGGIKQIRILIMFKHLVHEVKTLAHPRAVFSLKIGDNIINDRLVRNVMAFFVLFIFFFVGITLFLAFMGYDIITSFSAAIASLGNIGPGLARVGAIENYSFFDTYSKIVLIFAMFLGRLEIFSVLILLYSVTARKR
jgi:trk system potassium uptake protein TrkH